MGKVETTTIESLAAELGVSSSDVRDFVIGVSMHVNAGLSLESAIAAHADGWRRVYHAAVKIHNRASFQPKARGFVVDAFYPQQVAA